MDYVTLPYVAEIRDGAGLLYPIAWVPAPGRAVFPYPTVFRSSRFNPQGDDAYVEVGEQRTKEYVKSPFTSVPKEICDECYVGDKEWFLGDFPDWAPAVEIGQNGFATFCGGTVMTVQRVGLALPPEFVVTGSPVTGVGTLSGDWVPVPLGYVLCGPVSGPDAKPSFKPFPTAIPTLPFLSRVTAGPTACTALALAGVSGTFTGGGSRLFTLTTLAQAVHLYRGMLATWTNGGAQSDTVESVDTLTGEVLMTNPVAGAGTVNVTFTPYGYEWTEQAPDTLTGVPVDKPGGRSGTITTAPAFERNYQGPNSTGNNVVMMEYRGVAGGLPTYSFDWGLFPALDDTTGELDADRVRSGYPYASLSGAPDPTTLVDGTNTVATNNGGGEWQIDVATFPYADITGAPDPTTLVDGTNTVATNNGGGEWQIDVATFPATGISGLIDPSQVDSGYPYSDLSGAPPVPYSRWTRYVIDYTDTPTTISGQSFYVLASIPADSVPVRILTKTTSNWVNEFNLTLGAVKTSDLSMQGRYNACSLSATSFPTKNYTATYAGAGAVESDGTYSLAAVKSTGLTPSAGHTIVDVEWIDFN